MSGDGSDGRIHNFLKKEKSIQREGNCWILPSLPSLVEIMSACRASLEEKCFRRYPSPAATEWNNELARANCFTRDLRKIREVLFFL